MLYPQLLYSFITTFQWKSSYFWNGSAVFEFEFRLRSNTQHQQYDKNNFSYFTLETYLKYSNL